MRVAFHIIKLEPLLRSKTNLTSLAFDIMQSQKEEFEERRFSDDVNDFTSQDPPFLFFY